MILCDTNILIEFYQGNPAIVQILKIIGPPHIAVSVITKTPPYLRDSIAGKRVTSQYRINNHAKVFGKD
jgi:hypothetical protein